MLEVDRRFVVAGTAGLTLLPAVAAAQAGEPDEFYGPLRGWRDVRRDFGAVGDGRADDTAALQRALDALVNQAAGFSGLYIPAGRYRITRTLVLPRKGQGKEARGLSIHGEDPLRTVLAWDGPAGGRMVEYGAWYTTLGRLTFDGGGRAAIALAHGPEFVTFNEIADCVFTNVGLGIEAGTPDKAGIAETAVLRCRFLRCGTGAALRNWNSLDWWFWRCRFEDCGTGVTNLTGAGNFHVYDSVFLRSREADISIRNTGYFSFRGNLSVGSGCFFEARAVDAGCETTLQGNRIYDTVDVAAVRVGNLGALILMDNQFFSRPGQAGPVVQARSAVGLAIGNRYSAASGAALKPGAILLDEAVRQPRTAPAVPSPAPFAPRFSGPLTKVAPGTGAAAIQARIDTIAKSGRPAALYFAGQFEIDRTLTIPATADIRLIGGPVSGGDRLNWTGQGSGPLLRVSPTSRTRLVSLTLGGAGLADGVVVAGADAAAQVRFEQTNMSGCIEAGYQFERLERCQPMMRNVNHQGSKVGVRIIGAGPASARALILSGASSDNDISYELTDGARLVARDIWYESGQRPTFMRLSGEAEFTLNGSNIAPTSPQSSSVIVEGFQGRALFLGVILNSVEGRPSIIARGPQGAGSVMLVGVQGNGEFVDDPSGGVVRVQSLQYASGGGARRIADRGRLDARQLRQMLAPIRTPPPRDVATVRLTRVYFDRCRVGARISA